MKITRLKILFIFLWFFLLHNLINPVSAQNVGIGITNPESKLHVNGDLRLQHGIGINKFSTDSVFINADHTTIATQKAVKDYIDKGLFLGEFDSRAINIGCTSNMLQQPRSIVVAYNMAFVVSEDNDLFCIFDLSTPEFPQLIGYTSTNLDAPVAVAIQNQYAYVVTSGINGKLCIFNFTTPSQIVPMSAVDASGALAVSVDGDIAYVARTIGVLRFNVSNPNTPVIAGQTNCCIVTNAIALDNINVYVTNGTSIYRYGQLLGTPLATSAATLSNTRSIIARNNYVYAVSDQGLSIFDSGLQLVGNITSAITNPSSLFIKENFAYVLSESGLAKFDISTPAAPAFINVVSSGTGTGSLSGADRFLYVTSGQFNSLCVYEEGVNKSLEWAENGLTGVKSIWRQRDNWPEVAFTQMHIGVGISNPTAPLSFAPLTGDKIILYQGNDMKVGFAIDDQTTFLKMYTGSPGSGFSFGYQMGTSYHERVAFNNSGNVITVAGGAYCTGMSWNNASDRSVKENITPVNNEDILYGISQVPICRWNYKSDPKSTTHIGPMAQDFKAVFNTGADDKTISTIDPAGIALAGIQALLKRIEAMQKEIMKLKERLKVRNDDNKKKTCY